ncbi:ribosome biogenesis factor YjgA [Aestuariibacter salexigens]|uniref:ribosome biogenesis factor YjgA n=1 Tax=Aestuariibacter salexigens TaxID=226010 RepID=UPI0003FF6DE7|nr:ribosome biogenesis factor YjgA [Aestuariibacter salexigens]
MTDNQQQNNPSTSEDDSFKSKTQLKAESTALQKLGETLVNMTPAQRQSMPLDDELRDAIELACRINRKKDGYRRQLQFIGKLMRKRDVQPIELAVQKLQHQHHQNTAKFHHIEQARDAILSGGDNAIQHLLESHPTLDRQKLRQLKRQADKQQSTNKPPTAARELFQYLKAEMQD